MNTGSMKMRSIAGTLACLLLVVTYALAQEPSADDLKGEITSLKQTVLKHEQRIAALEKAIARLLAPGNSPLSKKTGKPKSITPGGWQVPSNWERIKKGMSERQVISILGQPTSVKNLSSYRTLFYRGFISGKVELDDDQVWMVRKPVFE